MVDYIEVSYNRLLYMVDKSEGERGDIELPMLQHKGEEV